MLNTEYFVVLAGNPEPWDLDLKARMAKVKAHAAIYGGCTDDTLCAIQVEQFTKGRRSAELVATIYGYSVRSATNLDNRQILFGGRQLGRKVSKEEAIEFGKKWANEDPKNREFYMRKGE